MPTIPQVAPNNVGSVPGNYIPPVTGQEKMFDYLVGGCTIFAALVAVVGLAHKCFNKRPAAGEAAAGTAGNRTNDLGTSGPQGGNASTGQTDSNELETLSVAQHGNMDGGSNLHNVEHTRPTEAAVADEGVPESG